MSSNSKLYGNHIDADKPPERFAIPHPFKSVNASRSTPKKTNLARSHSIPGLSSSNTPKASPVTARGGTPKSGKMTLSARSSSTTKLSDSGTPTSKYTPNVDSHFMRVQTNGPSGRNVTPVKKGVPQKHSSGSVQDKVEQERDAAVYSATPKCFGAVDLETPRKSLDELTSVECSDWLGPVAETSNEGETSNLTVGVRVRPLNAREISDPSIKIVSSMKDNEVHVNTCAESGTTHVFSYDHCFWSAGPKECQGMRNSSQDEVYSKLVHPLLDKAFEGYNACLFAYGQTGSGKSYSMMGTGMDQIVNQPGPEAGIIPRFCHQIFERISNLQSSAQSSSPTPGTSKISQVTVEISYFEIYNEKIHDLLGDSDGSRGRRVPLRVREHPVFGPHVVDLSTYGVVSYKDLQEWIMVGNSRRATAATEMNEKSSRSHSIFSVVLTQMDGENIAEGNVGRRSKINLVDLAGSERLSQTSACGDRLREGVSINRSLLTLGKVIAALSEGSCNNSGRKKSFIPYRDSVLTWLLRESLGGNSRTAMLATVSPANIHVEETLSTLRYATQAGTIVNRVRVNEGNNEHIIRELRAEIERLRALRLDYEAHRRIAPRRIIPFETPTSDVPKPSCSAELASKEIEELKQKLKLSEEQLKQAEKTWAERIEEADRCKSAEIAFLRRRGLAVCLNDGDANVSLDNSINSKQKAACLINLSSDPGLSGTLLYLLPPGSIRIGRSPNRTEAAINIEMADILLDGSLVGVNHCTIENNSGKLTLHTGSSSTSDTFVNGYSVVRDGCHPLKHGDRLVIGGNHFFLVNNPSDVCKNSNSQIKKISHVDFEFARKELKQIQEAKLHQELEEVKLNAVKELQRANEEAEKKISQQRQAFEDQINNLGHSLVHHKQLLENVEKAKRELENQKDILEVELAKGRQRRLSEHNRVSICLEPYQSNFFQELEDVLNSMPVADEDVNQSLNVEEEDAGLYEMHLMVKEANSLCKTYALDYEFHQVQVFNHGGLLEPKVKVCNTRNKTVTYWDSEQFFSCLHNLRDFEEGDNIKELFDSDKSWETEDSESNENVHLEENNLEKVTFSSCKTSIKVETTSVKKMLNDSISQLSSSLLQEESNDSDTIFVTSNCSDTSLNKRLTDRMAVGRGPEILDSSQGSSISSDFNELNDEVQRYLWQIEEATEDLLSVFSRVRPGGRRLSHNPIFAIEDFEAAMHKMKTEVMNSLKSQDSSFCNTEEAELESEESSDLIHISHDPYATPVKSSLRSPAIENSSSKKVRFCFPE